MMPVEFPESNAVFGKPDSMTDEQCMPVHGWKGSSADGLPTIITCWTLSKEDLEEIQQTGRIYFGMTGTALVPHFLSVESPFVS